MQQLTLHISEESLNSNLDFGDLVQDIEKLQQHYQQHAVNKNDDYESVNHEVRFGFVQWIYRLAVMITAFMTDVVAKKGANSKTEVFILNILGLMQKCKTIFTKFNFIFTQISLSCTTIDISSNLYLLLPLEMAAHIFQITSLFMGMLFVLVGSAFLILLTPLVITLITSILLVTFSISAINTAFTQIGQYVNIHAPKRAILVYFADKIPSSVGRVEISHSKQRQNYDKISTNKD